jgi:hypothetical protein
LLPLLPLLLLRALLLRALALRAVVLVVLACDASPHARMPLRVGL